MRKRLRKRLRKVARLEGAVDARLFSEASVEMRGPRGSDGSTNVLHALRKELKKLRYACEFVREAYPRRVTRRYLRRLGALQDVLGELQDSVVNERLLARHLKHIQQREIRADLRSHFQEPLGAATIRALGALPALWQDFKRQSPSGFSEKGSRVSGVVCVLQRRSMVSRKR